MIIDKITLRLFVGLLIDALIANGYLLPQQREQWVDGAVQVGGSLGAIAMVFLWHHNSIKHADNTSYSVQKYIDILRSLLIRKPTEAPVVPPPPPSEGQI